MKKRKPRPPINVNLTLALIDGQHPSGLLNYTEQAKRSRVTWEWRTGMYSATSTRGYHDGT